MTAVETLGTLGLTDTFCVWNLWRNATDFDFTRSKLAAYASLRRLPAPVRQSRTVRYGDWQAS